MFRITRLSFLLSSSFFSISSCSGVIISHFLSFFSSSLLFAFTNKLQGSEEIQNHHHNADLW